MISTSCFANQLDIPFDLPPFTLAADSLMAMQLGIHAIVDITAMQQRIILAMRCNDFYPMPWLYALPAA